MTHEIKKLGSETVLYGLGTILPRTLNFFLVPIQTRVFPQEDYGNISELYGYVAFANIIFLFGMETSLFRFSNKPGSNPNLVFRIAQTTVISISGGLTVLFLIFNGSLSSAFSITNPRILIWILLTIFIDALVAVPFAQMRLKKQAVRFTIYKLINIMVLVGLNLYFLYGIPNPTIELVFLANLIANSLYLIFFFKTLLDWRPLFDRVLTPEILKYSYPLVITGLAGMTNEMFSRIAIDNWLPKDFYTGKSPDYMQGIFSACYRFSVFMSISVQAFRFASEPFFFAKVGDKNSPEIFAKVNHYFTIIACTIMLGICLNMDWLRYFIDEGYWEGLNIVPVLLLGFIFLGVYYNISIWFKVTDKTYYGTIITIGGAVITVGLNYWLIPLYGIMGSSMVTLICFFAMAVACYLIGQNYYPVPYTIARDMAIIIISSIVVYINQIIQIESLVLSVIARGVASLLMAFIAYRIIYKSSVPS